jgi:hypothetical protein
MNLVSRFLLLLVLVGGTGQATALSLGPEEFAASTQLTCVLAQESLGYLSEDEYGSLTHNVLADFDASESDAIYAKALGYIDGLMFGIVDAYQLARLSGDTARAENYRQSRVRGLRSALSNCARGSSVHGHQKSPVSPRVHPYPDRGARPQTAG